MENELSIIDENKELAVIEEEESIPTQAQEDFDVARINLQELIRIGMDGLAVALNLVKESESPRAAEVFGNLLKTIADINISTVALHTKKGAAGITETEQQNGTVLNQQNNDTSTTNNNIFLGSTNDLSVMLKMIEDEKLLQNTKLIK